MNVQAERPPCRAHRVEILIGLYIEDRAQTLSVLYFLSG